MGFQLIPVRGFRQPGKVSWIGSNHVNRCTIPAPFNAIREQVIEFLPTANVREQWSLNTVSDPATPPAACPADYQNFAEPFFSDAITSRYGYGQAAPGVIGTGDIDGDHDIDIAVSGDGDRRLWWIEQAAAGNTILHRVTAPGEYFGQSGGGKVADFNRDGVNELVFSSYDLDTVAIWTPTGTTEVAETVASKLSVSPARATVKAGKKATWTVRLTGATGVGTRPVTVTFDPRKGKDLALRTVQVGVGVARFSWRPKASGTLVFSYSGTQVSEAVGDTAARDTAKVKVKAKKK
jgi:hypothetical protein